MRRATLRGCVSTVTLCISIHALREEGDLSIVEIWQVLSLFQSTPSVRRATTLYFLQFRICAFQSTPSVRRATDMIYLRWIDCEMSIHALREEGDSVVTVGI